MTKVGVAAVVAALAFVASAPAHAVPPSDRGPQAHVLVIRGAKSATVDVTFKARIRPHSDLFVPGNEATATTKGTYTAVWLQNLSKPELGAGAAFVPAITQDEPIGWASADREDMSLPAGRYRVRLVTDGISEIRLPIDGLARDLVLRPTGRSTDAGKLVRRQAVPGVVAPVDRTVIPVSIRSTTLTLLASGAETGASVAGHGEICLHDSGPQTPCLAGGGSGGDFDYVGAGGGGTSWQAAFFYPGDATPGEHDAEFTDATVGVAQSYYAFALTIT
jgi:hypothetical protein